MSEHWSNPYSARYVRPGQLNYCFADSIQAELFWQRWHSAIGGGQIVGPHGTGKSTLLHWLCRELQVRDHPVCLTRAANWRHALHDLRRLASGPANAPSGILLADGFETLSAWERWRLCRACRGSRLRLVVTTHRTFRLPVLYRTSVDASLAQRIARQLGNQPTGLDRADWSNLLKQHQGNMREVLFDLYDQIEHSRSWPASGHTTGPAAAKIAAEIAGNPLAKSL